MGDVNVSSNTALEPVNPDTFAAIVLAGGVSQRMGESNKLLLTFDGQSFIQRAVAALTGAGVSNVVVVLGHESEPTREQLRGLNVRTVVNPYYEQGQMTSVQCGLSALATKQQAVLICLADQPLIQSSHIEQLLNAFANRPEGKEVVVPLCQQQRGNPVVISEGVRMRVLDGGRHPGCRRFIDANPELVSWLSVDDEAFITDIDTPEEYQGLQKQLRCSEKTPVVRGARK